jgi:hypothetical protein
VRISLRFGLGCVAILSFLPAKLHAGTGEVSIAANGGVLVPKGGDEHPTLAMGGGAISIAWPVSERTSLGFRQSVDIANIPYGNNDGEKLPFQRSAYCQTCFAESRTYVPSTSFLMRNKLGQSVFLDGTMGVGLLYGSSDPFPFPTLGVAIEVELARFTTSALRLRAQIDGLTTWPWYNTPVLLIMPRAGLTYAF